MKKITFRIVVLIMSLIFVFAFVSACKKPVIKLPDEEEVVIKESALYLLKDGASNYKIVIPKNPQYYESFAAEELQKYFKYATNINLSIVSDENLAYSSNSDFIILGESSLLQSAGYTVPRNELGDSGFYVNKNGNNVFICGGGSVGTLYGVYEFLHWQFGFEVYALEEVAIQTGVVTKKLLDFSLREKPDIPYRNAFGAKYHFSQKNASMLKLNFQDDFFIDDSYQPWHNSFRSYFPLSEYENLHPEWYIKEKTQLSYTASGNAEKLKLMQDTLLQKMKDYINDSFSKGIYTELIAFTHEDNDDWANDASMNYYTQTYGAGAAAASLIHFLNPIARELKKFMDEEHDGRKMNIVTYAYLATESAPVKEVGNGNYAPIDDSVVLEDNLSVLYAPIYADYIVDLGHSKNRAYKETLDKWKVLSNNISFWTYSTYFSNYLMFYDSFNSMQKNFQLIKEYNAHFLFDETSWNYGGTAFNSLKTYLSAKLQWNVNYDMDTLVNNFFKNYYKDVSDSMLKLFNDTRSYNMYLYTTKSLSSHIFGDAADIRFWPQRVLDGFLEQIDAMYNEIEPLKISNPSLYALLYDRICAESITYRYLKLLNYSSVLTKEERQKEDLNLRNDCVRLGVTKFNTKFGINEGFDDTIKTIT